ncbi:SIR2 family protein [Clostridium perfringens]|nr:SIR2 family protein [Clostridium perfringens]
MEILFVSGNKNKRKEIQKIVNLYNKENNTNFKINVEAISEVENIRELQHEDINEVLRYKVKEVYKIVKKPVIVEHTALELECLNWYPGSQTQLFWDTLCKGEEDKGEKIFKIAKSIGNFNAKAKTNIGFCDGRRILIGEGKVEGEIVKPKGNSDFEWDVIFRPYGSNKTFAELSEEGKKEEFSMRFKAIHKLLNKLDYEKMISGKEEKFYNYDEIAKEIANRIKNNKLILFIGAGVSKNVGLPSWGELISKLGEDMEYDSDVFYMLGDYLELAEYYTIEKSKKMPRNEIYDKLKKYLSVDERILKNLIKKSNVCENLRNIINNGIKTIYTTNYDSIIELLLKSNEVNEDKESLNVIYDLETMTKMKDENINLIKLHGDLRNIDDIVLNQSSYFNRYDFENCLDIKLRGDMLTKSILFLGYSFSDINIKYMFYKLNKLWDKIDENNRPQSYIFLTEDNKVQKEILIKNKMIPIICNEVDKSIGLNKFLESILKELKKQI